LKEDINRRNAPPVGQYDPRMETIRANIRGGKWHKPNHSKVAKKRKNKLDVMFNKQPVCDRIIRNLNKKRHWMSPSEVKVFSPNKVNLMRIV